MYFQAGINLGYHGGSPGLLTLSSVGAVP